MLTDDELDVVICADLAAIYDLLQLDATTESFRESLRRVARVVEREAYKRAMQACMSLGKDIVCPEECAAAIEALGREE